MDKLKEKASGVAKGGWHPPGDPKIHRATWKSDVKSIATRKNQDPYEDARNHQSAPLTTLKDPDSFGPPPRHSGLSDSPSSPSRPPPPSGGWGARVPSPSRREQREAERQAEEEQTAKPSGPYKADTTGLRTDNLPKPPVRRDGPPATPPRNNTPVAPAVPPRQNTPRSAAPPPSLPPRMTEHPDEHTPPPPPTYTEATHQSPQHDPAAINAGAANRLSQAGVSVPGFGIGNNASAPTPQAPSNHGHSGQLSELQQRFARMNHGGDDYANQPSAGAVTAATVAAAAHKKPPPPPPPKKASLASNSRPGSSDDPSVPPLPLSSKPRPP